MLGFHLSRTGAANRGIAAFVTLAIAATLVVMAPAPASATQRDCDGLEDSIDTTTGFGERCVNGIRVQTRGTIVPTCWEAASQFPVPRGLCSDGKIRQAERIGQTRFI